MKKLWLLLIPLAAFAATNARPIYRGLMQSDLNAGGFSITNAGTVKAVRFIGSGSNLTDIASGGGDTFWVTNSDTGGISNIMGDGVFVITADGVSTVSTLTAGSFAGDGSALSSVTASALNPSGDYSINSLTLATISSGNWSINTDGSASFANTAATIGTDGSLSISGVMSLASDGSASFASGEATINTSGDINASSFTGDGSFLTSLNASQLSFGTVPDAALAGSSPTFGVITGNGSGITNLPNPTVTATNFVSGKFYTNSTGRTLLLHLSAGLTVAAVSGDSTLDLMVDESGGHVGTILDRVGLSTLVTSIAMTYTNSLNGPIVSGGVYWITNNSTGSGNSAAPVAGTGRLTKL